MRPPPEHPRALLAGVALEFARQAGLPDAGLAGDHHEAATTIARAVERLAQSLEFLLPSDEDIARHSGRDDTPAHRPLTARHLVVSGQREV